MPYWNMFADEVHKERHRRRDYGRARWDQLPTPGSYKAQALRELARRLELEKALSEVQEQLAEAIDRFEEAECYLDIHHTWAGTPPPGSEPVPGSTRYPVQALSALPARSPARLAPVALPV